MIFTTFSKLTDTDKVLNVQHFGSNPADIQIRIQINTKFGFKSGSLLVKILT